MKKRWMASLMTHQYKKLPVTMKMWMQINVMPCTSLGVRHAQDTSAFGNLQKIYGIQSLYNHSIHRLQSIHFPSLPRPFINTTGCMCHHWTLACKSSESVPWRNTIASLVRCAETSEYYTKAVTDEQASASQGALCKSPPVFLQGWYWYSVSVSVFHSIILSEP